MPDLSDIDVLILRLMLSVDGIGSSRILSLHSHFKSFKQISQASVNELSEVAGLSHAIASKLFDAFKRIDDFSKVFYTEVDRLRNIGGRIITIWDDEYPPLLRQIYNQPILIYILGEIKPQDQNCIAVVGTRLPSNYGKLIAEQISKKVSESGLTIVSGLARGIDTIAHKSALEKKGRTIAILGCGLNVFYPAENRYLYTEIANNGAVISEFPLNTKPEKVNFPIRNRIISGMSLGVLVIESKSNGGAIHTAYNALEQNREVFAIPGNINVEQSMGTNHLIKKGYAKLVQNVDDILEELESKLSFSIKNQEKERKQVQLEMFEEKVYQVLDTEPTHIDKIISLTEMNIQDCLYNLLKLEMKEFVRQLPGDNYIKI